MVIVILLLTSTKVSQINNMSKSCCPLYCHVGWRRAPQLSIIHNYLTGGYYLTGGCVVIVTFTQLLRPLRNDII